MGMIEPFVRFNTLDQILQLLAVLFQQFKPLPHFPNCRVTRIHTVDDVIHDLRAMIFLEAFAIAPDDTARNPDDGAVRRNIFIDDRIGPNLAVITDGDRAEYFCAHADQHPISERGMAFGALDARSPQGDLVVEQDVVADDGGLSDDDAHAVIDKEAAAYRGTGMDLDPGKKAADLGDSPREQAKPPQPEPVCHPVRPERMQAGIGEGFQSVAGGGIFVQDSLYIFFKELKHGDVSHRVD